LFLLEAREGILELIEMLLGSSVLAVCAGALAGLLAPTWAVRFRLGEPGRLVGTRSNLL
jgi:hypothetical protein